MSAKLVVAGLGLCLLSGLLAAAEIGGPSRFVAYTEGAEALTLVGSAEFGAVPGAVAGGPFVLTLGATSTAGAVVFTWPNGRRPGLGTYALSEGDSTGVRALVVTGSPTRPSGAFRARAGTLSISRADDDVLQGVFELDATGFSAARPMEEDRGLMVQGTFDARPSAR